MTYKFLKDFEGNNINVIKRITDNAQAYAEPLQARYPV